MVQSFLYILGVNGTLFLLLPLFKKSKLFIDSLDLAPLCVSEFALFNGSGGGVNESVLFACVNKFFHKYAMYNLYKYDANATKISAN